MCGARTRTCVSVYYRYVSRIITHDLDAVRTMGNEKLIYSVHHCWKSIIYNFIIIIIIHRWMWWDELLGAHTRIHVEYTTTTGAFPREKTSSFCDDIIMYSRTHTVFNNNYNNDCKHLSRKILLFFFLQYNIVRFTNTFLRAMSFVNTTANRVKKKKKQTTTVLYTTRYENGTNRGTS